MTIVVYIGHLGLPPSGLDDYCTVYRHLGLPPTGLNDYCNVYRTLGSSTYWFK